LTAPSPFARLSFMVVDDNRHMRLLVTTLLRSFGAARIMGAKDGAEAIELLSSNQVDIVLADYLMEPMNGLDFLRQLRRETTRVDPTTPVILMSGLAERSRVEAARDAGANEFLAKPLTAQTLFDRIVVLVNNPRAFVRCASYIGPDRRRRDDAAYRGPRRRWSDRMGEDAEDVEL